MSELLFPKLSLYRRGFCFFCSRVTQAINHLALEVENRDISSDRQAYQDLQQATGRTTVPVLRIETADGEVTWMPESDDIIQYLIRSKERKAV